MNTAQALRDTFETRVTELAENGRDLAAELTPVVTDMASHAVTLASREPNRRWIKRITVGLVGLLVVTAIVAAIRSKRAARGENAQHRGDLDGERSHRAA